MLSARPYLTVLVIALIGAVVGVLITLAATSGGSSSSGTDFSAMKSSITDLQHSGRTDWSIRTGVQTISGKSFKITDVKSDRVCFEPLPTSILKQSGCLYYAQIAYVWSVDPSNY